MRAVAWFGLAVLGLSGVVFGETLAIVDASILHTQAREGAVTQQTILIEDGHIVAVGKDVLVPSTARIIDASGRNTTPGFMTAWSHIGLVEVLAVPETNDISSGDASFTAVYQVSFGIDPNSTLIPIVRSHGLTRAMAAPESSVSNIYGIAATVRMKRGLDLVAHPKTALVVDLGESGAQKSGGSRITALMRVRALLERAKAGRDQASAAQSGVDALSLVLRGDMPLAVIADRAVDIRNAIEIARDFDVRVVVLGGAESWIVAGELARANVAVVLDPALTYPDKFETLGARGDTPRLLEQAGVEFAFSMPRATGRRTPGFSHNAGRIRISAGVAVSNGLSYERAIEALTASPARIWGEGHRYGQIAPGMEADIVIWDGDPLEIDTVPLTVIVDGVEIPRTSRQTLLRDRYHPNNRNGDIPPAYRN